MKYLLIIGIFFSSLQLIAQQRINFNEHWKFKLEDQTGADKVKYNDTNWRALNLPHDWSIEGEYDENHPMGDKCGYLPAGIGWYRKTIKVPKEWKGQYVQITFDGVFMNSTVWANGRKLGDRPYGWITFGYDISKEVNENDEITFAVRVDNDLQPAARWYTGSGIYANTWIDLKSPLHVPLSGIFVRTEKNNVIVTTELENKFDSDKKAQLVTSIVDANGTEVAKAKSKVAIKANGKEYITQNITIENPHLWSTSSPYLYKAVTKIEAKKVDQTYTTNFGVRDVEWLPETGVWINGENVKLQGVCNHQDAGALGAAVPDKVLRFRLQQLKDMGVNAIRTSHNPQTPQFYDMCDEMGLIVMDEIFDGWHKKADNDYGAHFFNEWWNRDLTDWIKRDRNHPSIIIYSVGNETRGEEAAKALVERCHELDNTRPVTSGHSGSDHMDVFGVNGHSEKKGFFDHLQKDRVFIGTENTHTWQVRGYYRTKTWYRDGYPSKRHLPYEYPDLTDEEVFTYDWTTSAKKNSFKQIFNSSYDNAMVRLTSRQNIEQLRDIPNYAGSFRWTGHDYIGEAGFVHGGWPFKAFMGGAIDMANFEKDLFYLYQSQWTTKPMIHILPHWTHPTLEKGVEIPVWVYSNCDEVELFINGTSLGKQKPGKSWDKMQCEWLVGYQEGELKAVGYKDGKAILNEVIRTAEAPSRLKLTVDGEGMLDSNEDIVQVRIAATDSKGEFYPYGENRSFYKVIGSARVKALDNGSPIDVEKHYEAKDRIAFYGLTRAYVESTDATGDINLYVGAILGEKRLLTSQKASIDVEQITLRGKATSGDIKIYYTTDGSTPTTASKEYKNAFDIELGTTVKALVTLDQKELLMMHEEFAADAGFEWKTVMTAANPGGDQAEDATFDGVTISNEGENFNGKGFIDFGKNEGGYVEFYQENDGSEGEYILKLRYSAARRDVKQHTVTLSVNGKEQVLTLDACKNYKKEWKEYEVKVQLGMGANTIRITALKCNGFCLDEMKAI
ncbi:glycoside hydrolase family 2 TIM barrel-domain containing protein [Flammeovirga pacifica]|uniref:Beta-galactosidase n=1 Tax=Flammeovirga pacifica TaxID=915059 RepID=A0A1S1YTT6_FLAPC|nr:glycoside hydrolase family 2 TIM barrel-domain containing protein [Flammeovirga pacifica]OHX64441.1 beta-galactosidase [Flammeovirga pacifica]